MTRLHCFKLPNNWTTLLFSSPSHEDNPFFYIDHMLDLGNIEYYLGEHKSVNFVRTGYSSVILNKKEVSIQIAIKHVEKTLPQVILKTNPNASMHKYSTVSYSKNSISISMSFAIPASTERWLEHYIYGLDNVMKESFSFDKDNQVYTLNLFESKTSFVFSNKTKSNCQFLRKLNSQISLFEQIKYISILISLDKIMLVNV